MSSVTIAIALAGVICVGTQAQAVDFTSAPTMSKRQILVQVVGCMRKRMSVNKNSSYNDAMKACKEQMNKQSDSSSSSALVASATPAKP